METSTQTLNCSEGLNDSQSKAFRMCIGSDKSILCTGPGGTGKSLLLERVVQCFRNCGTKIRVAVTASTGIAAFNIGGITLHKFAGVGIEASSTDVMIRKTKRSRSYMDWKTTDVLIIDEISMISPDFFQSISTMAKVIRNDQREFGGIRVLMFGDFLQLPPVTNCIEDRELRVFHTNAWKELSPSIIYLDTVMRQSDSQFKDILSSIRLGECSDKTEAYVKALEREIKYSDGIEPVNIFATRKSANDHNMACLSKIRSPEVVIESRDYGNISNLKNCPVERQLRLKVGSQVMLTRNLTRKAVNGSVGVVQGLTKITDSGFVAPLVKFASSRGTNFEMEVEETTWDSIDASGKVVSSRTQVPLILAWGMTIHRSQGCTIPRLCVDMLGVFEVSQAYVALSRCPDENNLRVLNFDKRYVKVSPECIKFYEDNLKRSSQTMEPSECREIVHATKVAGNTQKQWEAKKVNNLPDAFARILGIREGTVVEGKRTNVEENTKDLCLEEKPETFSRSSV